jgi:metal-sulfur cluster biosynthetic enzyme
MLMDIKEKIIENLREVYDPEISINVWDLGLIYEININEAHCDIVMTLTSAFCPMADEIVEDVTEAVTDVEEMKTCDVKVVFDPPFGPDKMSEDTRLILGV